MGEDPFSIQRYKLSLTTCIPNIKFLPYTAVEIALSKLWRERKKEQIQGKANRSKPIFNATIQLAVGNLYTKCEVSILNGCGDIFDENVLRI